MYCKAFLLLTGLFSLYSKAQNAYFQQKVNYDIKVRLDDQAHILRAHESIEYINESPSTITYIYFHLWPNAYKNKHTFLAKNQWTVSKNTVMQKMSYYQTGFIDSLDFQVNGAKVKWSLCGGDSIDMAKIYLNEPLLPQNKINISTPFKVKIPDGGISRFGHDFQQYYITQWYPKPAVFDQTGWHVMPYLENGEYYSEYGTFDVHITLPKNYVLGATGVLQNNPEEENFIQEKIENTKRKTDFSDDSYPLSSNTLKTLHYHQDKVHDFAWFCDKRYNVQSTKVKLPSGHVVTCNAFYNNYNEVLWRNALSHMTDAILKLSKWHGDYPYDQFTAVEGIGSAGADMEYPMITIIGDQSSNFDLDIVLMHELAHNWFAIYFGNNERDYPFIDEGIVTSIEQRYIEEKYPEYSFLSSLNMDFNREDKSRAKRPEENKQKRKENRFNYNYQLNYYFIQNLRHNIQQAINLKSEQYIESNYARIVYYKAGIAFNYLRKVLGNDIYDQAFNLLYKQHTYSHIQLSDIRKAFELVSKRNLSWFFDELISTNQHLDYEFNSITRYNNQYNVQIKNVGEIQAPIIVNALNQNDETIASYLINGFKKDTTIALPYLENAKKFAIDPQYLSPESYRKNNYIQTYGWFKRAEPLIVRPLTYVELPNKHQLFYAPIFGYNVHNGVMLGIALHNRTITPKKWEFLIMPMYATNSITPVGFANLNYTYKPQSTFRKINFGIDLKSYQLLKSGRLNIQSSYAPNVIVNAEEEPINVVLRGAAIDYIKVAPYLDIVLKPSNPHDLNLHTLGAQFHYINYSLSADTILNFQNQTFRNNLNRGVLSLYYQLKNKSLDMPYSIRLQSELFRTSLTFQWQWKFYKYKKGFKYRLFAGNSQMQNLPKEIKNIFPFSRIVSGDYGINSKNDFLFEQNFLGRYQSINTSKSLFNQWLLNGDGNLRMALYNYTNDIYFTNTVIANNFTLEIPKLPFSLYADVVADKSLRYSSAKWTWKSNYVLGVQFSYQDYFAVYLPILDSFNEKRNYVEKIAFQLNIDMLNPFKLLNKYYGNSE